MSKPVKNMLRSHLISRLDGVTSLAVVSLAGLDAITNNEIRGRLHEKDIQLTVVKNSMARQAFDEIGLPVAKDLLDGPCALAWGADSVVEVVRELLAINKTAPALTIKAAVLEGDAFGSDEIERLSQFPTRDEAIGKVVGALLGSGSGLLAAVLGPGRTVAGLLKTIEENQSEDGGEEAA
jgi:large subunit ribosomal protein L10